MKYGRLSAAAITCATVFAVPAGAQAAGYETAVKKTDPLTYLRMQEAPGRVVQDSSAYDRDGRISGAFGIDPAGPFTSAGAALALSQDGLLQADVAPASGSVELWVNPARLRRGSEAGFVAHGDPAAGGWALGVGDKRKLTFVTDGTRVGTKVTLASNVWSMVAVKWNASRVRVLVNGGASVKEARLPAAPGSGDGGVVLGGTARGAFRGTYTGKMDEVALFSRPLEDAEFAAHFAASQMPVNTQAVAIPGVPTVGSTISVQPGIWTGTTTEATYQWQRCDADGECEDIVGATGPTYLVTPADACSTLQVLETRGSDAGRITTVSEPSAVVPGPCPGDTGSGSGDGSGSGSGDGTGTGSGTGTGGDTGSTGTGTGSGTGTGTTGTDTGTGDPVASALDGAGTDAAPSTAPATGDAAVAAVAGTGSIAVAGAAELRATPSSCLRLVGGRRTVKLRKLGVLRLRVAGTGCITASSPLRLSFAKAKGKRAASVTYRLNGKVLRPTKRRGATAVASPSALKAGVRVLKVRVAPKGGKARTITLKLRLAQA